MVVSVEAAGVVNGSPSGSQVPELHCMGWTHDVPQGSAATTGPGPTDPEKSPFGGSGQERAHLETARAIAFTEGMAAAVERRDEAAVRRIVEPIVANDHAHLVRAGFLHWDVKRVHQALLEDFVVCVLL